MSYAYDDGIIIIILAMVGVQEAKAACMLHALASSSRVGVEREAA